MKACEDARNRTFRNIALTSSSTFGLLAFAHRPNVFN